MRFFVAGHDRRRRQVRSGSRAFRPHPLDGVAAFEAGAVEDRRHQRGAVHRVEVKLLDAERDQAVHLPRGKFDRHLGPLLGTIGVMIGLGIGVILSYIAPENLFVYVYSSSVLPGMVPWFVILISQIRFRKMKGAELDDHPFKMPFAPVTNYLTLAFLIAVLVGMWFNDDTRMSLIVGIVFLALVTISYFAFGIGKKVPLEEKEFDQ